MFNFKSQGGGGGSVPALPGLAPRLPLLPRHTAGESCYHQISFDLNMITEFINYINFIFIIS